MKVSTVRITSGTSTSSLTSGLSTSKFMVLKTCSVPSEDRTVHSVHSTSSCSEPRLERQISSVISSPGFRSAPLSGGDFRQEFNTDAKIIDMIRSGSVIGKQPITSMPHWGGILSDKDLKALVAYLKTLE